MYKIIFIAFFSLINLSALRSESPLKLDSTQIENLTGTKGEMDPISNTFTIFFPHKDLQVQAMGVKLTSDIGLTSWVTFRALESTVELKGELVLLEDQVLPLMQEVLENGLKVTILYNPYVSDSPKVMFMGIRGEGDLKEIAPTMGKVFEKLKKTPGGSIWSLPPSTINTRKSTLNPRTIEAFFDTKGTFKEGVYKLTLGENGQLGRGVKGLNPWIAFAGSDKNAVILGNFGVEDERLQNILKLLTHQNAHILSLYQTSGEEDSKIYVIHFTKRGPLIDLVQMTREVLEKTKKEQ